MKSKIVLDSYAILAYLENESGGVLVKKILNNIFLSFINLAEIYYSVIRDHGINTAKTTLSTIRKMPIKIVSATDDLVLRAAEVKGFYSIALGDCFAVALALQEKATILTGDPEFKKVAKLVKLKWLI